MANNMWTHNSGSPDEPSQGIKAASGMREATLRARKEAWRTVLVWGVVLAVASLVFAAFTTRPLARFIGDNTVAYLLGVLLHTFLGLSAHGWKLGRARRTLLAPVCGALALVFILGLLAISVLRAQLTLESSVGLTQEASPTETFKAYLISMILGVVEICGPLLVGFFLGNAWLNYEAKKRDFDYASTFALRITSENDPMEAWIHEAYSLKKERQRMEQQIIQLRRDVAYLDAQGHSAKADALEATIHTLEEHIREQYHRLSLIERWYPGNPRELHDTSDELLAPKTPATDNYTPQSPPLSLEANEPQQLPPPQTEPTSPQGDEPDKKEPKP